MNFAIGQRVWWVYTESRRGKSSEVEVTKVGRRWVSLSNGYRIDINSWYADGGQYRSPGRIYISEADYQNDIEVSKAWQDLKRRLDRQYQVPTHLTMQKIAIIQQMIFPHEKGDDDDHTTEDRL